ncbi:MAG: ABC transporter permease [Chloroflexi bacterium]|nr:ABC transporter permease [Chloroflexota bacterium]
MAVSSEPLPLTSPSQATATQIGKRRSTTPWRAAQGRFVRSRTGVAGAVVLIVIVLAAIFAAQIAPYSPTRQDFRVERQPPSSQHWMGTDEFGRDVFSRVIWGAQSSLEAGGVAATIALIIGVSFGMIAAFYGGRADSLIMRCMDVVLAFPYILLAIAVVAILGPGLRNAMIAIGIVYVPHYARVARGSVLSVRSREYVDAARALGADDPRIMRQHVLPNTLAPLIVQTTLCVGIAIIDTAGLSFLGLGTQPPTPDWGNMLAEGRSYVIDSPWIATFPGLAILVTVLAFNLMGDALRDAFDPRLR